MGCNIIFTFASGGRMMQWGQRSAGSSVWVHLKILTEVIRDEPSSKPPAHSPVTHGASEPWEVSSDLSEDSSSPDSGRWTLHSSNHVTADTRASPRVWHGQNRAPNCWEARSLYWCPVSLAARLSQYWMDPLQPSTWIGGGKRCSWIKRHGNQAALFPQVDNYCWNQRLEEA